ncbi:hypothetical protein B0O99DRAFT_40589 [Bisporella sp. PMI_857]|nr:hypothetical protein B0O99DRAFT_40589 [Bisporella sp. PMI_857]
MSSACSSRSPAAEDLEQPRKKGARGGKRAVTHLSKAQLARKRANDREAQRNIRARIKAHIETLKKRVEELEASGRSGSVERIIKRNEQLEVEVEGLRAQLALAQAGTPEEQPPNIQEKLVTPHKAGLEWLLEPEPGTGPWIPRGHQNSPIDNAGQLAQMGNDTQYPPEKLYLPGVSKYEDSKKPQDLYIPSAIPIWDDQIAIDKNSQGLLKPTLSWTPFHPVLPQPSGYADLNPAGFSEVSQEPLKQVVLWYVGWSTTS